MPFAHRALFYRGTDDFLAATVPFVRDGVVAGEPVMVAVGARRLQQLEDGLGDLAAEVEFVDMTALGRNPARIIPAWRAFADRHAGAGGLRGIGEPAWPGRSDPEVGECHRHESLLNLAFADAPAFELVCPYDARRLPAEVLDEARRTHPVVSERGLALASDVYLAPEAAPGPFAGDLPEAPAGARTMPFAIDSLHAVRRLVAAEARLGGLDDERRADLAVAVTEVATNAVRHGGGGGRLRVWREAEAVVVEVEGGGILDDPLAGRVQPGPEADGGWGLWLVNHLCDLVQIRSRPSATVVRLRMAPAPHSTT